LRENRVNKIAGVDEVGRGTIAGPVVSAAIVLDPKLLYGNPLSINESKKLSEKKRVAFFKKFITSNSTFSVGYSTHDEIDKYGILESTKMSMLRAIERLGIQVDVILIDSVKLNLDINSFSFNKADSISVTVASASIVAKVSRDALMSRVYENLYPGYFFKNNKGYGSKLHVESLYSKGISRIHRKSFKPVSTFV